MPATGNYLVYWANAGSGRTSNPLAFTVTNANPTVTAVFASLGGTQTNALTVVADGRGQVTLTPPGSRFPLNTVVVVRATPEAGQEFLGWAGAASGSQNPLVVTLNSNQPLNKPPQGNPLRPAATGMDNLMLQVGHIFGHIGQIGFNHIPWSQDSRVLRRFSKQSPSAAEPQPKPKATPRQAAPSPPPP